MRRPVSFCILFFAFVCFSGLFYSSAWAQQATKAVIGDDVIPDSLLRAQADTLRARFGVQRTVPVVVADLDSSAIDLKSPDNIQQVVEYDDTADVYYVGSKMGGAYLNTPVLMTLEEYLKWSEQQSRQRFFRQKNTEHIESKGQDKFSFADMHFDLGPAEKIFGPGGVRIRTQGTAELKFGATMKNIDNPSLPIRNRKTTSFDFDEKINLNVNGRVGDKVNMNLNYNTDATFDFDAQNLKLKYEGKEDEIIKLMQFGRLKLQTVLSQKKSSTKSVSSKGGTQTTPFEFDVTDYEENRHFFLSHYFHQHYDEAMSKLPNLLTGIVINRVEIWVTNKTGTTTNTRNIVALADLGENSQVSHPEWKLAELPVPCNQANTEYGRMTTDFAAARDIDQTSTVLSAIKDFEAGKDYEKLASARLLTTSEYSVNTALGYVSLKTGLQTDQVLAVAYEFTYGGVTYQVGEFASDQPETTKALFVKSLKNTSNNPTQPNWRLMMKNVYYLASTVEKTKFRLDIKYQSDTAAFWYLSAAAVEGSRHDCAGGGALCLLATLRLDEDHRQADCRERQIHPRRPV